MVFTLGWLAFIFTWSSLDGKGDLTQKNVIELILGGLCGVAAVVVHIIHVREHYEE